MSSKWKQLAALGQSVWYDNVARPALADGLLERLMREDAITGGTSNPSIFSKAVLGSDLYDDDIAGAPADATPEQVFETCAIADIQAACDLVRPIWESTDGADGYISIEEEAAMAFDAPEAVRRGHELRALVDRPNVMIKVPGTLPGVEAFEQLTREGVSVNVTLLFSRERYHQVAGAYVRALQARVDAGEDLHAIASVASFFVSRIDSKVDDALPEDSPLRGRIAVANAKLAYADVFVPIFGGAEFQRLAQAGANVQRPLWASTGVKNKAYSQTLYIDELVGRDTVTTVPDATIDAFRDAGGEVRATLREGVDEARRQLDELRAAGVSLDEITSALEHDGVKQFADAYDEMIDAIARKRDEIGVA
ncbi:transaldolase [Baekduia soli]|uniref:Transaldolase n=1 Tax=Baekduia soli TaxID=496014 RepID=A0A5B8U2W6_9ACTN|nr:transaldolase [Baekduia soli]QEC47387.1 transaldolase [Baekduia soli]